MLDGLDALLAIAQMPPGVPVAAVGVATPATQPRWAIRILTSLARCVHRRLGPPLALYTGQVIARYSRPAMARVCRRGQAAGVARRRTCRTAAWAELGVVPPEPPERWRKPRTDPTRVAELEATLHHDTAAFVDAVAEQLGEEGRWFHYGAHLVGRGRHGARTAGQGTRAL